MTRVVGALPPEVVDVDRAAGPASVPRSQGGTWREPHESRTPRPRASRPEDFHGIDEPARSRFHGVDVPSAGPSYGVDEEPTAGLRVGQWVHHPKFGKGRLRQLTGRGPATKVVVEFVHAGRRTLVLQYARLTPAPGG